MNRNNPNTPKRSKNELGERIGQAKIPVRGRPPKHTISISEGLVQLAKRPEDYEAVAKVRRLLADGVNPSEKSTVEKVR